MKVKFLLCSFIICKLWCYSANAQGGTLALNGTVSGNIAANANDKWQITTNADGYLQCTINIDNDVHGTELVAALYDSNGSTVLTNLQYANPGFPAFVNMDGLAAGTYFIKIYDNLPSQTAAYTLTNKFTAAPVPNDVEPNDSRNQADLLMLNDSTTGHVGYYYNNHRDTADWYKVTTTSDGLLRLTITAEPSTADYYVYCTLYDNDGKILLNSVYATGAATNQFSMDGLAAGTYYVKISQFGTYNDFVSYKLADSLFTYKYAGDGAYEPNGYAAQAHTILSDSTTTGHFGFYYNNQRDTTDWYKVNYTNPSGGLNLTINLLPHLSDGQLDDANLYVYKDTSAAPVYQATLYNPSNALNIAGLTEGYYYIKIIGNNYNFFAAYSITNSFTQVSVAAISLLKSASNNTCGTDSLIYSLSGSHSPYTVRLYRSGALYDSLTTVSDSAVFVGLNSGNYYATVYGDGATGTFFGQSTLIKLLPPTPTGLNVTYVMSHSATLNWSMLSCTSYDTLEYRANDTATWKILITTGNSGIYNLTNLASNVTYLFRVASVVNVNGQILSSPYSSTFTFKTLSALPVTLVNFIATANSDLVTLSWSTATEINNKGFEIFRSVDGTNFTSIGFVAGAGNSDLLLNYQFTDKPGLNGNVFYRLKQIDVDGKFAWSNIVSVNLKSQVLITFMPNPAHNFINISSPVTVKEIRLVNTGGQLLKVWNSVSPNAQLSLSGIAKGIYMIQIINDKFSQTQRIVVE